MVYCDRHEVGGTKIHVDPCTVSIPELPQVWERSHNCHRQVRSAADDLCTLRRVRLHDGGREAVADHDGCNRSPLQGVRQPDGAVAQPNGWRAAAQAREPAPPPSLHEV